MIGNILWEMPWLHTLAHLSDKPFNAKNAPRGRMDPSSTTVEWLSRKMKVTLCQPQCEQTVVTTLYLPYSVWADSQWFTFLSTHFNPYQPVVRGLGNQKSWPKTGYRAVSAISLNPNNVAHRQREHIPRVASYLATIHSWGAKIQWLRLVYPDQGIQSETSVKL